MHWIDWSIVGALVALLVFTLLYCRRFVRSTADFLAANRCAGRYLLTITSGIAGIGAISIIAMFELYYKAGFTPQWWGFLSGPLSLIIAITGWVYYRMRETRCLTMAQFFEVRYSRKFRIFSGFIGWLSGILNYGIFPAVSVKFFIYFCGLPDVFTLPGIPFTFSTYVCLLLIAMSMGVFFAINGGQVGIMLTDFIQGMFCNASFLILMVYLLLKFNWGDIFETLTLLHEQSPNASMVDPFATTGIKDFNIWYFLIPMTVLVALAVITGDILVAVVIALGVCFAIYIPRRVMSVDDFMSNTIAGFADMLPVLTMLLVTFVLKDICNDMGMTEYIIERAEHYLIPAIFPAMIFFLGAFLAFTTGSDWGMSSIITPIAFPLGAVIGADPVLIMAAIISGGTFGSHACFYSDATLLAAQSSGIDNMEHGLSQLPYALIAGVLAVACFMIAGFIM